MSPLSQSKSPCFIWLPLWSLGKRRKLILIHYDSATQAYFFAISTSASDFFLPSWVVLSICKGLPQIYLNAFFKAADRSEAWTENIFTFKWNCGPVQGVSLGCWAVDALFRSPSLLQFFIEMDWKGRILLSQWSCLEADAFIQARVLESHYNQHQETGWKKWLFHYSQHWCGLTSSTICRFGLHNVRRI